jgi:hypothetical protein
MYTKRQTVSALSSEILNKVAEGGIDIESSRGQGYNNASNIGGNYNRMQANILQKNPLARFVSCAAHRPTHAGVHAASLDNAAITFFGILQKKIIFLSFPRRWEMLMNVLRTCLKGHSGTR